MEEVLRLKEYYSWCFPNISQLTNLRLLRWDDLLMPLFWFENLKLRVLFIAY
jgi:hypothetical protein